MAARGARGFTLVELLVALTLLAFLSLALFGGLRFGARSWEAVTGHAAARDAVASAQGFLRARLSAVSVPRAARELGDSEAGRISGGGGELDFTAPWLSALSLGGLYDFRLWFEAGAPGEAGRLMLSWRPSGDTQGLPTTGDGGSGGNGGNLGDLEGTRVLLEGVDGAAISYWGTAAGDSDPAWHDEWQDQADPPGLVRIDLTMADPGNRWPDFVVAPGS